MSLISAPDFSFRFRFVTAVGAFSLIVLYSWARPPFRFLYVHRLISASFPCFLFSCQIVMFRFRFAATHALGGRRALCARARQEGGGVRRARARYGGKLTLKT